MFFLFLQNNLERQEYETKSRLTGQIDGLEQEVTVLKQKLTFEQDRNSKLIETLQVGNNKILKWNEQVLNLSTSHEHFEILRKFYNNISGRKWT